MIRISKGKLAGLELTEATEEDLTRLSRSTSQVQLRKTSFYQRSLSGVIFQGLAFTECNFAKATLEKVTFSRCKFSKVDFTRTSFKGCFFSDCTFSDCDIYYPSFSETEVDPASFKNCFLLHEEWNKALILFAELRRSLREIGESRLSRKADYFFRVWQRRRLFHRWKLKRIAGFAPWFWSLCIGALNGYGERPQYLAFWAFGVVSAASVIYKVWLPYALNVPNPRLVDYWFYSFKVFFAQGLSAGFQSVSLMLMQTGEFLAGLILVSLLIGSTARKLSP